MAQKTFLVQWTFLLRQIQRYGASYQANMAVHLNPEQIACVANVLAVVSECLVAFGVRSKE